MSYITDKKRVQGFGSANSGSHHFITQRVTAVALVPLVILFIIPFGRNLGAGYEQVLAAYAHPFNAIIALLFIITVFKHLSQGLQVVIEDYVPKKGTRTALLLANTLCCWLFGLTGVFAIAKIAL